MKETKRYTLVGALLITLLGLIDSHVVHGQYLSPEVINVSGLSYSTGEDYFDMSVGEVAVTTLSIGQSSITQGFLQPISLFSPCSDITLIYYPNPVIKDITIIAAGCDLELDFIQAYDMFGKLVLEGPAIDNTIDLTTIGVGVYLLRAYDKKRVAIGTVKIVKTTV